jgi:ABC-2 type transport system permease protein
MTAFATHFVFEFRAGLRSTTAMLLFYLFPLGFYAAMGLVMVEINPTFGEVLIPAMIVVTAMAGTVLGLPAQLVEAREAGIHRSFKVNGVPAASILLVPTISAMVHVTIVSIIIAVSAGPLFGVTEPTSWPALVLITVLLSAAFSGVAAVIGVVSNGPRGTVLWGQLVFLPSMLIGGLMIDLSLLPDSVVPVAKFLPSTYAMQALVGAAFDGATVIDVVPAVLALAALLVVSAVLARMLFSWDAQNQTRKLPAALGLLIIAPLGLAAWLV